MGICWRGFVSSICSCWITARRFLMSACVLSFPLLHPETLFLTGQRCASSCRSTRVTSRRHTTIHAGYWKGRRHKPWR